MNTFTVSFTITVKDDEATETEQTILDAVNSSPLRPLSQAWSLNKSKSPGTYRGFPSIWHHDVSEDR